LRCALQTGGRTAVPVDETAFVWAKRYYYKMMGWDGTTGVPTQEALERLDIGWAAEHLADQDVHRWREFAIEP
jgi:hypothetical protein